MRSGYIVRVKPSSMSMSTSMSCQHSGLKKLFFEEGSAGKVTLQEIQTSSAKHQKDKKNISWKREHGEKQTGFKNLVHRKSCSKKKAVGIFSLGSASSKSWSKWDVLMAGWQRPCREASSSCADRKPPQAQAQAPPQQAPMASTVGCPSSIKGLDTQVLTSLTGDSTIHQNTQIATTWQAINWLSTG